MKLRYGYLIAVIVTGLYIFFSFLSSLPDGKLHIIFCNVGQGDAAYIKFPDGRDMIVDGGPNDAVLGCLGKYMPFWDRDIDLVFLTHPEKDHLNGLLTVLERFRVGYFIHSNIQNATEGYASLRTIVESHAIHEKLVQAGEHIAIGNVNLTIIWPSSGQLDMMARAGNVLGASTDRVNDGSVVFWLRYGSFDALFTGDADTQVESSYTGSALADTSVELLKVPHHGSKTGMNDAFLDWLKPRVSVISVGKNSYGHPAREMLAALAVFKSRVLRTDKDGDIKIVTDGVGWKVE